MKIYEIRYIKTSHNPSYSGEYNFFLLAETPEKALEIFALSKPEDSRWVISVNDVESYKIKEGSTVQLPSQHNTQ